MNWAGLATFARHAIQLPKTLVLSWRLFMDQRVSSWYKLGAVAAALLAVSPLDPLSDIPIIGPLDDVALLLLLANAFVTLAPRRIVDDLNGDPPETRVPNPATMKNVTPKSS